MNILKENIFYQLLHQASLVPVSNDMSDILENEIEQTFWEREAL